MKPSSFILPCFFLVYLASAIAQDFPVFTENLGQIHDQYGQARPDVLFGGSTSGLTFHLRKDGISYQIRGQDSIYRTDLYWEDMNPACRTEAKDPLPGLNHYYNVPEGAEPVLQVRAYREVLLRSLYAGIDLRFYSESGGLKYEYILQPGADWRTIRMRVEGAEPCLQPNGKLLLKTPFGDIEEGLPLAFQGEREVAAYWVVKGPALSFEVGPCDPGKTLIIDPPVRLWGTYYGGNKEDYGYSCVTDGSGNVYLAGQTASEDQIATTGVHQTSYGHNEDAFLVKFTANGVRLWGTYYGGSSFDNGQSCAVNGSGQVYMAGNTFSLNNISSPGAHQQGFGGGSLDAFLVKFNSNGIRQWATYYGGSGMDSGFACAADEGGNVYLVGQTISANNMATPGAHQTDFSGGNGDAFLVKFNTNGVRHWGTYYGGSNNDRGNTCAVDGTGQVYLGGQTASISNMTTSGAHQTNIGGGLYGDAFLAKFNANGLRQWSTYYGGGENDEALSCSINSDGDVYLAGYTLSSNNISTSGAYQPAWSGDADAFLVKFDVNGVRQWGTYYGGDGLDRALGCTTDDSSHVFIVGNTRSTANIASPGAYQTNFQGGDYDIFCAKFSSKGVRRWGTYYGGEAADYGISCATDGNGDLYLAGSSASLSQIASPGSHQTTPGGFRDAMLVKFELSPVAVFQLPAIECMTLAPNPNPGAFLLKVQSSVPVRGRIYVVDALGRNVWDQEVEEPAGEQIFPVILQNPAIGWYWAVLEVEGKRVAVKFLVIK